MADEIRADYEQLEQIAQRFNQQSQEVQQMLQRVRGSMEKLQSSWEGRGSASFFREMRSEVLPATSRLHSALQEAGRATAHVSNTVRQAEEEAGGLFRL